MRFLDKVTIVEGGGRDDWGNPRPETESEPIPATMTPVKSDSSLPFRSDVISAHYRLLLHKKAAGRVKPNSTIKWHGRRWTVQGDIEEQVRPGGRVHHLAATVKFVG